MLKRIFSLLFLSVFLFSFFTACSKKKSVSSSGSDQTFVFNNRTEPEYLDPGLAADTQSSNVIVNLFEGLTRYHPKDLSVLPGVAHSWKISTDGKTYTFFLRQDAKWSDGSAVTAEDFVYSWRRVVNPSTASNYASLLYSIKNAREINSGKEKPETLGVKALDPYTLEVQLENPTPYFLHLTQFYTYAPVQKKTLDAFGDDWTRQEHIVSNGPFILTEWIPQKHIVMEPNPHYWGRDEVKLKKIYFLAIEDLETSLKKYLAGEIHFLDELPPIKLDALRNRADFVDGPWLGTYYIEVNTTRPILNQKLVRQALAHAIDRKQLVAVLKKGIPSSTMTPENVNNYIPPSGHEFNIEKAKQLLAEAGYPEGKGFPKFVISYNTHQTHQIAMEVVQNMLNKNLGINVEVQNLEFKVLLKQRAALAHDLARAGWIGDFLDPYTFLELYTTTSGNNHSGWSNKEYDDLIQLSNTILDPQKRNEVLQKAERILLDESPIVPLYTYTEPSLISPKVTGIYHNLQNIVPLRNVSMGENK